MILYFDSYITDIPLIKSFVVANDSLRSGCKSYAMPKKTEIAKYSLASYATYPWSHVFIRYELDDPNEYKSFDDYILKLFPKAIIMHERCDSQADLRKSIEVMDGFDDDWIFYSCNNDHPMITSNPAILDVMLDIAKNFAKKHDFVSIINSHFSFFFNLPRPHTPPHTKFGQDEEILDENDAAITTLRHNGENSSVQIVNKKLFKHWFDSKELGNQRIIRPESVKELVETHDQVIVIPKVKICDHFDGYSHTISTPIEILPENAPPLFIPNGFFENNIRIAYGYDQYREGWTNVNPAAKTYCFIDPKHGTDLKLTPEELPLFWKTHIKEVDINPKANLEHLREMSRNVFESEKNIYKETLIKKIRKIARMVEYRIRKQLRKIIPKTS